MHSGRMHTGRSLTVCRSLPPGGGLLPGGEGICSQGEGVCSGGVSAPGGSGLGGCLLPEGCLLPGVSAQGRGGVYSWGESQHALRQTPPVNRMTDTCKNITLATTSLRPVMRANLLRKCRRFITIQEMKVFFRQLISLLLLKRFNIRAVYTCIKTYQVSQCKCFDRLELYLCPFKCIIYGSVAYCCMGCFSSDQSVSTHVKCLHISILIGKHYVQ